MLNESLFFLSFNELRDLALAQLTIYHIALVYVLMFVIYKAFGRYIYFKPQEHASKINRTFLAVSLLVVALQVLSGLFNYLPILPEYRWFYIMGGLVFVVAPLSIISYRTIWKYQHGRNYARDWHYYYLPISRDYYKTSISKSERDGNSIHSWQEEGVESTDQNIHSDALLNVFALIVFLATASQWAYGSFLMYGWHSLVFSVFIALPVMGIFFDEAIFSWIYLLERNKAFFSLALHLYRKNK